MSSFSDQRGEPLSPEQFFVHMGEAILANYVALVDSGAPRDAIKVVVGRDGGTVTDGEALFQTPVTAQLNDADSRKLLKTVGDLIRDFDSGAIPDRRLDMIKGRHNVANKIRSILQSRGT